MSRAHLAYLDGWRGLAITFLMIGHFFPVPGINLGTVGVNLFFVLSGFLMAKLLFIREVPISLFYKRRITRIFPTVFVFLGSVVLFFLLSKRNVEWVEVGAAALFVNNYFPDLRGAAIMPFGHFWSLCVEEHSYVLLSLIAVAARRGWVKSLWALAMFSLLIALVGGYYWTRYSGQELNFGKWIHSEVSAFGIFISACLLLYFRKRSVPAMGLMFYPTLLIFGLAMHWWSVPNPVRTVLGVGAFALLVNLLTNAPKQIHYVLSFRPLRQLGIWSFSIYVWQQPFYLSAHRNGLPVWEAFSLALAFGLASFYLIEKPVREHLNRVWATEKPPKAAVSLTPL